MAGRSYNHNQVSRILSISGPLSLVQPVGSPRSLYSPSLDKDLAQVVFGGDNDPQQRGEAGISPDSHNTSLSLRVSILACICLMSLGSSFATASFSTLKPTLVEPELRMRLSKSQFSLVECAFDVAELFLPLASGMLLGMYGSAVGVIITTASVAAANIVVGLALLKSSYPILLLGRLFFGIAAGSLGVVQRVIVAKWFAGAHIGTAMAVLLAFNRVGETVGLAFFLRLAKWSVATGSFAAAGLSFIGVGAAVLYGILSRVNSRKLASAERVSKENSPKFSMEAADRRESHHSFAWRALLHFSTSFWVMALLAFLSSGVFAAWDGEATDILIKRNQSSDVEAVREVAVAHAIAAFVSLAVGPSIDKLGHLISLSVLGHIISVAFFALMTYTKVNSLALMSVLAATSPLTRLATVVAVPILVPSGHLGTAFAVEASLQAAGVVVMDTLTGRIEDADKDKSEKTVLLFFMFAVIAALVVNLVWFWLDRIRYGGLIQRNHKERHAYMVRKQNFERRAKAAHVDVTAGMRIRPMRALSAALFAASLNVAWILFLVTLVMNPISRGAAKPKKKEPKGPSEVEPGKIKQ